MEGEKITYLKEGIYILHELNPEKINSVDDCRKILKFLSDLTMKPLQYGREYAGFEEVSEYYD